jgi:hypothetical protein
VPWDITDVEDEGINELAVPVVKEDEGGGTVCEWWGFRIDIAVVWGDVGSELWAFGSCGRGCGCGKSSEDVDLDAKIECNEGGASPLVLGAEGREVEIREEGGEDGSDVERGTDEDEEARTICGTDGVEMEILVDGAVDVGRGVEEVTVSPDKVQRVTA